MSNNKNSILRSVYDTREVIEAKATTAVLEVLGSESKEKVIKVSQLLKGILHEQMESLVTRIEKQL